MSELFEPPTSASQYPDGSLKIIGAEFEGYRYFVHNRSDVAVIIAHFNPAGWKKPPKLLYDTCVALSAARVEVIVVQLMAEHATPAVVPPGIKSVVYRSNAVMFHKENLFNIGTQHTDAPKLMFIDGDVIFDRLDIFDVVSAALDECDVMQPYQFAAWLDFTHKVTLTRESAAAAMVRGELPLPGVVHPGFAWAMTRKFHTDIGGFYDCHPFGAGDTALSYALYLGNAALPIIPHELFTSIPSWIEFRARVVALQPKLNYITGTLYHLWHGTREKRQYVTRNQYMPIPEGSEYPLQYREDGVLEWQNPRHSALLRHYFQFRDEDDESTDAPTHE
jgi:hypothetical protein